MFYITGSVSPDCTYLIVSNLMSHGIVTLWRSMTSVFTWTINWMGPQMLIACLRRAEIFLWQRVGISCLLGSGLLGMWQLWKGQDWNEQTGEESQFCPGLPSEHPLGFLTLFIRLLLLLPWCKAKSRYFIPKPALSKHQARYIVFYISQHQERPVWTIATWAQTDSSVILIL